MVIKCQQFILVTPSVVANDKPMYGKHFESMYTGSMVGAGSLVFAVMGYVIAHQKPDKSVGSQVELNPKLLAFILGEPEKQVAEAISYLCAPDPKSRSKESGGRRLVKLGEYSYQVVNGAKYHAIRDEERRREQNREAKRRERLKTSKPLNGELETLAKLSNGQITQEQADATAASTRERA